MSLLSVITVLFMPLRMNICYFPLMSYISSSHFLSVTLHHRDVVVCDAHCRTSPLGLGTARSSATLITFPFLRQPVVLLSSIWAMHSLL